MRILLIGEYSGLHNSLKAGLLALGHDVLLVGTKDGFKSYPVDIDYTAKFMLSSLLKWPVKIIFKFTKINLIELEYYYRFKKILPRLSNYDVVQLINETSIKTRPDLEIKLLEKIKTQNKKMFLLSCGTDYTSVLFAHQKKFRYSILTPLHNDPNLKKHYQFILKYLKPNYKKLHDYIFKTVDGVMASDIDYHLPLQGNPKYLGLVPNPINLEKIQNRAVNIKDKIIIFHGINSMNYIKKGNRFFEEALVIIKEIYGDKIHVITAENLPYNSYIKAFENCHILLDQVYAYDQGYNALEAMAKGKVVFTGAEQEWLDYYHLTKDTIAINALPDVDYLVSKLKWLIDNPAELENISKNAHAFIEKAHNYTNIGNLYLKHWKSNT
ncbi:MAG: glycosyltransferase family 1 protein [Flavobacteriaceae bacterium]|nr:glycosyltransferase family 1 protein [Flavobacteriaceae bacterium]